MATEKQKQAIENIVENRGNVSKGMRDAGYAEKTAKNPKNLTESKAWLELMEDELPDSDLLRVHKEGLNAGKKVFKNNNATGEIEEVGFEPDYPTRHKYLETAYKIKGKHKETVEHKFDLTDIIRGKHDDS